MILLSTLIEEDQIIEMENHNKEKFHSDKLLVINPKTYDTRVHSMFVKEGINLRVYDPTHRHNERGYTIDVGEQSEHDKINTMCHSCHRSSGIMCEDVMCSKGHDVRDGRTECEDRSFYSPGC